VAMLRMCRTFTAYSAGTVGAGSGLRPNGHLSQESHSSVGSIPMSRTRQSHPRICELDWDGGFVAAIGRIHRSLVRS
jgi:hypothetical protein